MASEEDSFANAASKKRVASRQISKDDDPDVEEEAPLEGDTFRKAPDSVLASRRIVKVRRTGGNAAAAPAAANPFASIRLVPPSAEPKPAEPTPAEPKPAEEPTPAEPKPAEEPTPAEPKPAEAAAPAEEAAPEPEGEGESKEEVQPEAVTVTVTETMTVTATADDESSKETTVSEKVVEVVQPAAATNGTSTLLSSETFQLASSAKNAFSASFGSGFPATTTPFGSNLSTSGGFGSLNGGFSFGSGSAFGSSLFGSSTFGQAANPVVFEKTNGSSTAAAAASVSPASAAPAKITLQEVPLETGEEKEKAVFTADASLFEFLDGGWKERGKGEIKVSVPDDTSRKSRLVMRSKGNLRLLLNANIFPDMKITKMDNRGVTFVCANATAGGKEGFTTYALKLRDPQTAKDFMSTVEAHKGTATSTD